MKKYTVIILLSLLACIVVGLYVYGIIVQGADPMDKLFSTVGVVCTCLAGCIRAAGVSHNRTLKFYEDQYKDVVKESFSNQPKMRKKLLNVLRDFNEKKYEKCIKNLNVLKRSCENTPDYYAVNLFIGLSYTRMKQYLLAEEQYFSMINRGLADNRVFSNLGNLQINLGKFDDAIQNFNYALDRNRKDPYAYNNLAHAYFEMYELDTAVEYAKKATEIDPKMDAPLSLLAIIYGLKNDKENYNRYYHLAISAGAKPVEIYRPLAYYRSTME